MDAAMIIVGGLVVGLVLVHFVVGAHYDMSRQVVSEALSNAEIVRRSNSYRFGPLSEELDSLSRTSDVHAVDMENELRRLVALLAVNEGQSFILPNQLQETWRAFVSDHRVYHGITTAVLGDGGTIENRPTPHASGTVVSEDIENYRRAYFALFGSIPSRTLFSGIIDDGVQQEVVRLRAKYGRYTKTLQRDGEAVDPT